MAVGQIKFDNIGTGTLPNGVTKLGISASQGSQFKINNETTITIGPAEIWESPEGITITAIECTKLADNTTAYVDYATGTVNEDSNFYGARQGIQGKEGLQGIQGNPGTNGTDGQGVDRIEGPTTIDQTSGAGNTYKFFAGDTEVGSITVYNGAEGQTNGQTIPVIVTEKDEAGSADKVYSTGYINTALMKTSDYITADGTGIYVDNAKNAQKANVATQLGEYGQDDFALAADYMKTSDYVTADGQGIFVDNAENANTLGSKSAEEYTLKTDILEQLQILLDDQWPTTGGILNWSSGGDTAIGTINKDYTVTDYSGGLTATKVSNNKETLLKAKDIKALIQDFLNRDSIVTVDTEEDSDSPFQVRGIALAESEDAANQMTTPKGAIVWIYGDN